MRLPSLALPSNRIAWPAALARLAWWALALGITLVLLILHLTTYPRPWFDEGLNISTAATLARDGLYALPDSAGARVLDPAIQVGPAVIVPIALGFKLFGPNLLLARVIMLGFAALAGAVYLLLTHRLFDRVTMWIALLFLLVGSPQLYASFLYMSRQVLGEVPALAYYGMGMLLLLRGVDARRFAWAPAILAGLAWGIAMTTKSQIMIWLPMAIALVWLLDRTYYRQLPWHALLVPMLVALGCVGIWYGAQVAIAGPEQFRRNAEVLRQGGALHILGLNLAHMRNALGVIWHAGFLLWGLPGLLWAAWLARKRSRAGLRQALLLALPSVLLIWFVVFSVGWGRYAFYPFIFAPIWTSNLIASWGRAAAQRGRRWQITLAGLGLAGLMIWNGWSFFGQLFGPQQDDFAAMRQYLATQIPANALIETWEWEISLDARQPIHHPVTSVTNTFTVYMMGRQPIPDGLYAADQARPVYILEGTFGRWTTIYDAFLARHGELIVEYGQYALYRVRLNPAPVR